MENQVENNSLDQTIIDNQVTESVIPKDNSFQPVMDMFDSEENNALMSTMDLAQLQQLDALKPLIDSSGVRSNANAAARRPTLSTNTFDPVLQQNPPNLREPGGFERMMDQSLKSTAENFQKNIKPGTGVAAPTFTGMVQSNFKRYYEHPEFQKLGWKPYADNEAYYNANSTIYDDMSRMWGQFGSLVGTGYMSGYRSIGAMFSGESMVTDLKSANEFEDAMRIGNSSRDGGMAWTNNLLLNSAYTFGIIGSIAVEEVALAALEVVTFGGATPLVAGKTALNAARLVESIGKATTIGRMLSSGRSMMTTLKGLDAAKDFWSIAKVGGKMTAGLFAPETLAAVRRLKTTEVVAQNLSNMAKASEYAGSFYRDVRALNLALSESKLEGGMVYNQMIKDGMDIKFAENNNSPVTTEQVADIANNAHKAAFATTMTNMPVIYLTNKLVLGNSLGGFNKSLGRIFNEQAKGIGSRIIKTAQTVGKDGVKSLSPFKDAGTGLKGLFTTLGNAGVKGNLAKLGQGSLRYFAANLGEGIQEVSQEAISTGTRTYYTSLLKDPMAGGPNLFGSSVKAGLGSQLSAQGFDVFMSGFLMGGVVSGPQKLFFQGVPALYQRVANPQKYAEYKQKRDDLVKSTVDAYNAVWNTQAEDPNAMFDPKKYNFLQQKVAAQGKTLASINNNQFDFVDETDFAKFNQIHTVLSTGGASLFQDQLTDYMKMSDEDLATAFPSSKKDIKNGKIRERLQSMVNQIDKTEQVYKESKDRNPNPFMPEAYEKGSRQWTEETIKKIAFEHARYLYMFTQDGFTRALERSNNIYQNLASEPLFEKMAASDLTVLLDQDSIDKEIQMLTQEAIVLSGDKINESKVKEKTERVERLSAFKNILLENQNKDGSFNKKKIGLLRKEFENYVKYMAQAAGTFVNKDNVDAALKQIVDYTALKGRAKVYDKAIEYLNDPQKFDLVFQRSAEVLQEQYKNRKAIFEQQVRDYVGIIERNELANQIAKAGFIPDNEQMQMFLETGDSKYLKTFYNQKGEQLGILDIEDIQNILALLNDYEQTRPDKKVEEVKTDEVVAEEGRSEVDDILDGITIEVSVKDSVVLDNTMKKAYARYAAKQTAAGKKPITLDKWINSEDGKNHRAAFIAVKKIWIDNDTLVNPNNPLTEEEIETETKLIPWLQSQEGKTNDLVQNVVNALGLTIDDVTGQTELLPSEGEIVEGNKNVTIIKKGNSVSLIELKTVDAEGNISTSYQLVDQYKQPLDEETLNRYGIATFGIFIEGDKEKALSMQKTLDDAAPDTTKFIFDDVELNYGQLVYDQTGKEFIVVSQPKQVGAERKLLLVPSDEITPSVEDTKRATIPVKPGEFKASFSVQDLELKVLPQSVSRLNINEPIQPYAYRNKDAVTNQWLESAEQAAARYNLVMSVLSPEELNELELVISLDPEGGLNNGNLIIPGFKEANPYIQTVRANYSVGIRTSNPIVQDKINAAIEKNGLNKSNSPNGVFGFMQNTNFIITNSQGTVINPATMTVDEYKNIIYIPAGMDVNIEEDLKRAQDNFALNNLLSSVLSELIAINPDGVIAFSKLPNGLSFISKPGVTMYDKSPKPLTDLQFSTADENGNYLIYQLENSKGGRTKVAISNLEGEERRQLIDRVEESLTKQGLLDGITSLTDAYVAAVLLPDGSYALVNLKAKSIDINEKFLELLNRAELTLSDNPEKNTETFDKRFNVDYNKGLRSELFISAKPGYRLSLQVSPWGKIELEISDSNNKQIGIVRLNKSEISNKDLSTEDKLNLLLDKFNQLPAVVAADVNLTAANFRASYSREAGVQEILDKTTTQVAPQVVSSNAIQLTADSSAIQAAKNIPVVTQGTFTPTETFTDAEGNPIPKGPELTTAATPEEVADNVNTDIVNPEDINVDDIAALRNGVRLNKLEAVKQQLEILKAKLTEGLTGPAKIKAVKESKEYQDLLAERKRLENEANKIIDFGTLTEDVEDIDAFKAWAALNLPDFITIDDIETLGNNLKAGGVRVGAFVLNLNGIGGGLNVNGTLFTGAKSPFKYHEAFHGVFRMLLTDAEINKYLAIARREVRAKLRAEGKSFEAELQRFRNSANTYSEMSRERLEQEYYEEYLADEFEKFKANAKSTQTDSTVKSLFTRIIEWIQSVFKSFTRNQLLTLFENIDAGKFKNTGVSQNQFVTSLMTGVSLEANALLPYDTEQNANNKVGYYFLDSAIAEPLVSSIAAMYIQEIQKVRDPNVKRGDILENVMNDFAALYDEESEANQKLSDEQKKFLPQISEVFYNFSDELKSEVYKVLNIITKQTQEEEYNNEYFEEEVGLRNVEQFNMDASMIGGFGSLSEGLRSYLATTTIEETDYFGNKELKPGVKLIVPINFVSAYNGLLKAVKNIEDPKKMLQNMYFFGLDNPQTGAVVTRLLQDFGISEETLLEPGPLPTKIKNAALFQSVVKGFTTFRVDYLFVQRDNTGAVLIYSAAQRDDINSQLESWSQAWGQAEKKIKSDVKVKNETVRTLEDFASYLKPSDTKLTGPKLSELSSKYSQDIFRLTGIKLSKQFIAFSIASSRNNPTIAQAALINANSEQTPISYSDILEINKLIQQDNDIFSEGETGASSRLKTLAIQNAPFDETIGASVFKNPEGNLVYAHQLPTFHLKRIQELNDVAKLESLKDSDPYLANNFLLNSDAFLQMSAENRQKVLRIAGSSVGKINTTEEELNDKISGVSNKSTYGNYTPQEFALSILNTYTALLNTKSNKVDSVEYFDDKLNKTVKAALAPILIRVLEASNTGDLMYMPVVKTVKFEKPGGGKVVLTDETINAFVNTIEAEYDRIRRESNPDTKTEETQLGYNTENGRAFKLTNSGLLLTPELKASLEGIAKRENAPSLKEALKELNITDSAFKSVVNIQLESQYNKFSEGLKELQIENQLSKSITEGLAATGKANQNLIESAELLNLTYDKEYNLKQIFFNDWINTTSINDVLLGDQAMTLKDGVDAVKRAKMQNAAYYSAYTSITAEDMGVMHTVDDISLVALEEPTGVSALTGNNIDRSDAQMWMTTKAFRYMWFGFGKLNPAQAKLIDKIEAGEKISSEEIFGQDGYVDMDSMLNSKKLVYGDGKTFIKMSAFVLTPELTSNKVVDENGNVTFVAKENKVELHNLRVKLEAIEKTKDTISIAAPLSALKMLKQRVNPLSDLGNTNSFTNGHSTLSAKYMGLQVLTPSNKTEVIDATQVKNIVTSEQKDDVYVEALGMTVGQIRTAYNLATSTKVELKYKNKRNLIFSFEKGMQELAISKQNNKITPNLMAFLRYATEGLKASQASSNLLEFFSTQEGEQKYDLNNPITLNKFEQLFLSYLSKGVLAEKAPGHSVALVSDFGTKVYRRVFSVDENGVPDRSEIIRENVWNSMANKPELGEYDTLSVTLKDNKEGVVILDRLRSGVKEYDKDGKFTGERYTEMLMPAHFKSVMDLVENTNGKFPDVLSKMFGVRIPSQDNHSTINVKHVDFLPAFYGSSAMFAQELIEISGADFDIDKVYMQIKEFYEEKGKFYEYGKQTTDNGKYTEYLKYVSEKVNQPGTTYAEALEMYKNDFLAASIENSVTDVEQEIASDAGLSENGIKALQILGLPITKEQYLEYKKKFREPYEAPMNNAILDYKYALMGNTAVTETTNENETPISYTAAGLKILTDSLEELEEVLPGLLERSREDNIDINNIIGKIKAFTNNKGASIGAIVLPNVYLSLLTEYGITIKEDGPKISVNGITYDDFGVTREQLANGLEGLRKQDIISSLITMATDNAKERLVAKLGLNKHALGVVANLTALGVPIKTSLLLINNPMIQDIYSEALNKKDKLDPGVPAITKGLLSFLIESVKTNEKIEFVKVNDNLLIDAFNNPEEVTDTEKIAILNLFLNAVEVKEFTANMSAVAGLTNGLGKDISAVNEKATQVDKLFEKDAIMDLNPIYKSKTWQSKYLEIFNQIKNDLLPVTFLSASENFQSILTKVFENVNSSSIEFTQETRAKISRDLLSYLTIKAYQQNKLNNDPQSVATLNNNLVYPGGGYESINDIVDRLRTTEAGQNNFFLDNFAISVKAADTKNQSGLNLLNANTFRSLNAGQKIDLQNSFAKLYGSLETKNDALSIINYIMVKDGLQLGYASLLEAISPFTMDSYLSQIETANKALRTDDDANIKKVFGLNKNELESDFVNNYLQSNINGPLLYTISRNEEGLLPKGISIKDNKITIKWDNLGKGSPKDFVRYRIEDIQTGYVSYKTYMSTNKDDSTTKVYEEIETKGSNQQNPIGFMFGERPTYKAVRDAIKIKNANTGQDAYADSIGFEIQDDSIFDDIQFDEMSFAQGVQTAALQNEDAVIDATDFGVNINGNNIANINALEAMLNAETEQPAQEPIKPSTSVEREYTPENITTLKPNEVFVFGANTAGGHGGGTAGLAQRGTTSSNYTALPIGTKGKWSEYGIVDKLMQGTEGKSFGIVTKAATISGTSLKIGAKRSVPLSRIEESINALIKTASENPSLKFLVTKFGTNMAGFSEQEMKSLLENKNLPDNIILPKEFEVRTIQPPTGVKLFNKNDKELKKGSVVEYNGKKYLFWNDNNGKAQLINTDGTKFSGTPNLDKLTVIGAYTTTMYDNTEYIVTDNNNIYSGATGNLVFVNLDGSTKSKKAKIIKAALESLQNTENVESETDVTTTLVESMSDLERELYEEFEAEMESDYSAIENFWDTNIQKNPQAKENLRVNNNVLSLEDLIDMYNKGIYTSQEEFIEQIKQCNL